MKSAHTAPSPARQRLALTAALCATALLASSCTIGNSSSTQRDTTTPPPSAGTPQRADPGAQNAAAPLPPAERPVPGASRAETCPYLDGDWVQKATGQRLTGTSLDTRFNPPACIFWSFEADPQLTVWVRHMPDHPSAVAVVDAAAPIATTQKATAPEGWSGGRGKLTPPVGAGNGQAPSSSGAVYAVWKGDTAVVALTAQDQSVKAQQAVEQTITALGH